MATDWITIKTEYVNGAEYSALADKYKIKEATVRQQSSRHKWLEERHKMSLAVTAKAISVLVESRAEQLANFNADDIRVAKAIRAKAATMMRNASSPQDLRARSGAFDTAQKIGRLALGATTENNGVTGDLAVMTANMDEKKYLEARKQALGEC